MSQLSAVLFSPPFLDTFTSLKVVLSSNIPYLTLFGCGLMGLLLCCMTDDGCIAGNAYPIDALGRTPIDVSSCDFPDL